MEMAAGNKAIDELLSLCDLLIDGHFIEQYKDLDLLFRGSSNQRILDLSEYPQITDVSDTLGKT